MGDYWTNAVRHPEDVGIGHIRRTISFDQAQAFSTLGIPIGALEAGAIPRHADVLVADTFDGGTTLTLGPPGTADGFATSAAIAPGAAGWKDGLKNTLTGAPLAANTIIYAKLAGTPTKGKAIVTLTFVNKREIEGRAFPNNP